MSPRALPPQTQKFPKEVADLNGESCFEVADICVLRLLLPSAVLVVCFEIRKGGDTSTNGPSIISYSSFLVGFRY
jgi:hypothetical protein